MHMNGVRRLLPIKLVSVSDYDRGVEGGEGVLGMEGEDLSAHFTNLMFGAGKKSDSFT